MNDVNIAVELFERISGNIASAKDVLSTSQLSEAKAKLATIQQQGAALDLAFDEALAAATKAP